MRRPSPQSPRVLVDTPNIAGSINLKGGRIDDVSLKAYHETTDKQSPIIELFSPSGSPHPYYSETGFIPEAGQTPVASRAMTRFGPPTATG